MQQSSNRTRKIGQTSLPMTNRLLPFLALLPYISGYMVHMVKLALGEHLSGKLRAFCHIFAPCKLPRPIVLGLCT